MLSCGVAVVHRRCSNTEPISIHRFLFTHSGLREEVIIWLGLTPACALRWLPYVPQQPGPCLLWGNQGGGQRGDETNHPFPTWNRFPTCRIINELPPIRKQRRQHNKPSEGSSHRYIQMFPNRSPRIKRGHLWAGFSRSDPSHAPNGPLDGPTPGRSPFRRLIWCASRVRRSRTRPHSQPALGGTSPGPPSLAPPVHSRSDTTSLIPARLVGK
ncbi:hypothetical protein B0J18DRAFT_295674 [Chaetomium sp. MPI-SDFR-AT-0129]|nr:hypothetical protein B0J18DRAFT_295674 [Chaetomium sp. MPI-SDFR-AT-0129]